MRRSRFWAKDPDRRPDRKEARGVLAEVLTVRDACDRCGTRASVRVLLPSRRELLFCAHHYQQYASALADVAPEERDETERPAPTAA